MESGVWSLEWIALGSGVHLWRWVLALIFDMDLLALIFSDDFWRWFLAMCFGVEFWR